MKEVDMRSPGITRILIVAFVVGGSRLATAFDPDDQQGTHLQAPNLEFMYVDSALVDSFCTKVGMGVSAPHGTLIVATSPVTPGTVLSGMVQETGQAAPLRRPLKVKDRGNHKNPYHDDIGVQFEYQLIYDDSGKRLCGDSDTNNWALAIPGLYSGGTYVYDPAKVSFACIPYATGEKWLTHDILTGGGLAAKCVDWGYQPWLSPGKAPWYQSTLWGKTAANKQLAATDEQARQFHKACLSMGTADYCGNGTSHTADGTWIAKYDDVTVHDRVQQQQNNMLEGKFGSPPSRPYFFFEAAWRPPLTDPIESGGAFCLTKKRWATMPLLLAGEIASDKCPSLKQAEFCHLPEPDLEDSRTLLFTYSLFLDVGLYTCSNSEDPPRWRTSTTEQLDEDPSPNVPLGLDRGSDALLYTYKDATSVFSCGNGDFEGTVLRADTGDAPLPADFPVNWSSTQKPKPQPLYLHNNGGQYKTDATPLSQWPTQLIGYILPLNVCEPKSRWCGPKLKIYWKQNNGNDQYLTTWKEPPAPFDTANSVTPLGYLINLMPQPK
jgi:hypothetical protein